MCVLQKGYKFGAGGRRLTKTMPLRHEKIAERNIHEGFKLFTVFACLRDCLQMVADVTIGR